MKIRNQSFKRITLVIVATAAAMALLAASLAYGATTDNSSASAASGRKLFVGETSFVNGGPPCMACHSAGDMGPQGIGFLGGGTLSKDLTDIYPRYGESGVVAILKSLQFPVMKDAFQDKPLVDQEVTDMTAYFKQAGEQKAASATTSLIIFALIGLGGFLAILLLSQLVWGKRIHGVRKQLVGGSK